MTQDTTQKHAAPQDSGMNKKENPAHMCEGQVVSLQGNKLVMSNHEGKETSVTLAADAKVTCDGTACKAEDLKVGRKIRVTTRKDDRTIATGIDSLEKNAEFALHC